MRMRDAVPGRWAALVRETPGIAVIRHRIAVIRHRIAVIRHRIAVIRHRIALTGSPGRSHRARPNSPPLLTTERLSGIMFTAFV
jgi:hypothetical protein